MKHIFAFLTVCIVTVVSVPVWAQNPPVYRDPHTSRATMGPDAHDGIGAASARGPVAHPISRHARVHYRRGTQVPQQPQHRKAPRLVRTAGSTADQLNRDELARIQGDVQMPAAAEAAPAVAATPRALDGPRVGHGAR